MTMLKIRWVRDPGPIDRAVLLKPPTENSTVHSFLLINYIYYLYRRFMCFVSGMVWNMVGWYGMT